jgi:hypothetical protein
LELQRVEHDNEVLVALAKIVSPRGKGVFFRNRLQGELSGNAIVHQTLINRFQNIGACIQYKSENRNLVLDSTGHMASRQVWRAEERGRPVVLDAGLPSLVLVDEHPQRGIEAGPDVVLRHTDGEQGVAEEVLGRFLCLAGLAVTFAEEMAVPQS